MVCDWCGEDRMTGNYEGDELCGECGNIWSHIASVRVLLDDLRAQGCDYDVKVIHPQSKVILEAVSKEGA